MTETPDERALVDAVIRERDERAFRLLYRRHTPALHLLALRLAGGSVATAEELVQDAWVRAVERLRDFAWQSALRTWLSGFVVHRWREVSRERARAHTSLDQSIAADHEGLDREQRLDLERAVRALPDGYRQVFVLHEIEGVSHEDIASLLGIRPSTSRSQLLHARRALRLALADHDADSGKEHRA